MEKIGIYIHIPFCIKKCSYCDFISFANKEEYITKYIDALNDEIKNCKYKGYEVDTIYIGGGTPSSIDENNIYKIISSIKEEFNVDKNAEITIEVNPGAVNEDKLNTYFKSGVNRLSIGLQSTDNKILKQIGRIHSFEDFLNTYNLARKVGFKNINVDLMLGLPNQTLDILTDSLNKVIKLNPEHISLYSLILEEGTLMESLYKEDKIKLPNDDIERKMYWKTKNILEDNGYNHYEISNFSKKGFESKHNSNCWNQKEYIGFGLAAHSYIDGKRFCNTINLSEYIKNIEEKQYDKNIEILEMQGKENKEKEYMLLGLRKIEGVSIQKFKNKFSKNPIYAFRKQLEKLINQGLLEIDLDNIKLTNKGLDLANIVWKEFV